MEILKDVLIIIGGLAAICVVGLVLSFAGVALWLWLKYSPKEEEPRHHDWQYKS